MREYVYPIVIGLLIGLCAFLFIKIKETKQDVEYVKITDTIQLTDTITDWQPYYVQIDHMDTIKMPIIETDTILKTDSILVQIPINTYIYDTTITDTNYQTSLKARISGFGVEVEQVSIHTKITRQEAILVPKQKCWGVGVGLMYGTAGWGVGVGIFLKLF